MYFLQTNLDVYYVLLVAQEKNSPRWGFSARRDTCLLFELVVLVIRSGGEDLICFLFFSVVSFRFAFLDKKTPVLWEQNNPEI